MTGELANETEFDRRKMNSVKHVVVVGGGFTGLSAGYELSRRGVQVSILECEPSVGGLAGSFDVNGGKLEKFYHHWFNSDGDILKCRAVKVNQRIHPAEKPIELITRLIDKQNGKYTLDPFLGSGTTAVACKQLNRHFIGIEINPDYCKIARKRLMGVPESLFKEVD